MPNKSSTLEYPTIETQLTFEEILSSQDKRYSRILNNSRENAYILHLAVLRYIKQTHLDQVAPTDDPPSYDPLPRKTIDELHDECFRAVLEVARQGLIGIRTTTKDGDPAVEFTAYVLSKCVAFVALTAMPAIKKGKIKESIWPAVAIALLQFVDHLMDSGEEAMYEVLGQWLDAKEIPQDPLLLGRLHLLEATENAINNCVLPPSSVITPDDRNARELLRRSVLEALGHEHIVLTHGKVLAQPNPNRIEDDLKLYGNVIVDSSIRNVALLSAALMGYSIVHYQQNLGPSLTELIDDIRSSRRFSEAIRLIELACRILDDLGDIKRDAKTGQPNLLELKYNFELLRSFLGAECTGRDYLALSSELLNTGPLLPKELIEEGMRIISDPQSWEQNANGRQKEEVLDYAKHIVTYAVELIPTEMKKKHSWFIHAFMLITGAILANGIGDDNIAGIEALGSGVFAVNLDRNPVAMTEA